MRTGWRQNVELFQAIRRLPLNCQYEQLRGALRRVRAGLERMRMVGLRRFHRDFWKDPKVWYVQPDETFVEARNRLCRCVHGLGLAKTSFVLEMAYPTTCKVVCLDTHLLQLYGFKGTDHLSDALYHRVENHWIRTCEERSLPSPQFRNAYWDLVHGQRSTHYWSYCLLN